MKPKQNSCTSPAQAAQATWRYSNVAILIHWTSALIIFAIAALGWYMMSVENEPGSGQYFALHKSLGLVLAMLVATRLVWRLLHRPAPLPTTVPKWEVNLARGVQWLMYVMMVLMPLSGFLGGSFSKYGVQFFGLSLPHWFIPDPETAEKFFDIHSVLIWVLVALVTLHILGALKHLLLDKDGTFQRMWFKCCKCS